MRTGAPAGLPRRNLQLQQCRPGLYARQAALQLGPRPFVPYGTYYSAIRQRVQAILSTPEPANVSGSAARSRAIAKASSAANRTWAASGGSRAFTGSRR